MRLFYITSGNLALLLGFTGIFLPLLPTTPFVLLAAYCFARSSPRLHQWLVYKSTFGPGILQWQQHRCISKKIKYRAIFLIVITFSISILLIVNTMYLRFLLLFIAVTLIVFLARIPSQPPVKVDIHVNHNTR